MHARERPFYLYLLRDGMSNNGAPGTSETGSCLRWAYEGEVEQWAEEEVERRADGDECIA